MSSDHFFFVVGSGDSFLTLGTHIVCVVNILKRKEHLLAYLLSFQAYSMNFVPLIQWCYYFLNVLLQQYNLFLSHVCGLQNPFQCFQRLHTDLFAIGGHQVEATGGDIEVDGHASKLQVALPQDTGQSFGRWLRGSEDRDRHKQNKLQQQNLFLPMIHFILEE